MKRVTITVVVTLIAVLALGSLQPTVQPIQPVLNVLISCGVITDGQRYGSVVAIGPDLLLTAGHCIGYLDAWIEINGQRYEIVEEWADPNEDIGLIRVDLNGSTLIPVQFGPMPGLLDTVYLVGAPFDIRLVNSLTKGIVSHLDRDAFHWDDLIQTDAAGGPGSSGGPLLDEQGRIIGICVATPYPGSGIMLCEPTTDIEAALARFQNRPAVDPNTDTEETRDAQ